MDVSKDILKEATTIHLSSSFPDLKKTNPQSIFVREQIDHVKQYVGKVYVIVPTLIFPRQDGYDYKKDYTYDNVMVQFPKYIYPPKRLLIKPVNYRLRILRWIIERNIRRIQGSFRLIHGHFGTTSTLLTNLKRKIDIPLIVSFYGYDAYNREYDVDYYQELTETADLSLALSNHMKQRLISLGFPENKVLIHHLGVDTTFFKPLERKTGNLRLKMTTLAYFVEKKGILDAVNAFAIAKKSGLDIEFEIIGFGPLQKTIENEIERLNLNDSVTIVDNRKFDNPRTEIAKRLQHSDLFILPSKVTKDGNSEGTPVVLMEASASGTPCITTQHSGIPEIVLNNHTGKVVPEGDIEGLASAIVELASDEDKRIQFGRNARQHIVENFNMEIQGKRLAEIYSNLLMTYSKKI